jgi:hypothetical protein
MGVPTGWAFACLVVQLMRRNRKGYLVTDPFRLSLGEPRLMSARLVADTFLA